MTARSSCSQTISPPLHSACAAAGEGISQPASIGVTRFSGSTATTSAMTSEREWGVYPTVSALAIYQLATRKDLNAIAVTRWVWNGREKLRDETDE